MAVDPETFTALPETLAPADKTQAVRHMREATSLREWDEGRDVPGVALGWTPAAEAELDWLAELDGSPGKGETTGYEPSGLPDGAWVPHAMYEHERGPTAITHD